MDPTLDRTGRGAGYAAPARGIWAEMVLFVVAPFLLLGVAVGLLPMFVGLAGRRRRPLKPGSRRPTGWSTGRRLVPGAPAGRRQLA